MLRHTTRTTGAALRRDTIVYAAVIAGLINVRPNGCVGSDQTAIQSAPSVSIQLDGSASLMPDGRAISVASGGRAFDVMNIATQAVELHIDVPSDCIVDGCLAVTTEGSLIAIVGRRNEASALLLWSLEDGALVDVADIPASYTNVTAIRADGSEAFIDIGGRGYIGRYSSETRTITTVTDAHPYYVEDLAHASNGAVVLSTSGGFGHGVELWQVPGGASGPVLEGLELETIEGQSGGIVRRVEVRRNGLQFVAVDVSKEGEEIAAVGVDPNRRRSTLYRWDRATSKEAARVSLGDVIITNMRYAPGSGAVFVCGGQGPAFPVRGEYGFGLVGRHSESVEGWIEVDDEIISHCIVTGEDGFVSISTREGGLMIWRRDQWPMEWYELLASDTRELE